ncbi:MAG: hypothetical protein R8P61_27420 [Bacteroidia bacterium]|nr:hypothetical protein [Bacteroidia bacterium]
MRHSSLLSLVLSSLLFLMACESDPGPAPGPVYEVPELIQPYIDAFEFEASKRGLDINIENLRVDFGENLNNGQAAGLCTSPVNNANVFVPHIELDTTSANWQNNVYHREILVFHELGHCILDRLQHRDDFLPNNNISSMMRSTGEQVYGSLLTGFKRDYYLDELFLEEQAETPEWAQNSPAYNSTTSTASVLDESFDDNGNNWTVGNSAQSRAEIRDGLYIFESKSPESGIFVQRNQIIDQTRDFEIETNIKIVSGTGTSMFQWGGNNSSNFYFLGFNRERTGVIGNWSVGVSSQNKIPSLNPDGFNKITIRKTGDFYHLYVNETYHDILEFEPFMGNAIGFLVGPSTEMHIDDIRIDYLD